jgi:AcrR family transcriptional regulator
MSTTFADAPPALSPERPETPDPSPKRLQILAAAADLFIEQGYGAVSMDTVARAAAVSKATLYAHFRSKDALFATIIDDACRSSVLDEAAFAQDSGDVEGALAAIARHLLRFILTPRALAIHRVVIAESPRFPELGRAFYENGPARVRRALGEWLVAQTAAGRLAIEDPMLAADQFGGLITSGPHKRAVVGLPVSADEIETTATEAAAMFCRAYRPRASAPRR